MEKFILILKQRKFFELLVALGLFVSIHLNDLQFYHVIAILLELMVIIEVIQMLFVFFEDQKIKICFMVDASIIFFIRELLIATTNHKPLVNIGTYVFLIAIFFVFRYFAVKFSYNE
jgi:uncharacterized membrane protein (DUF373 family)